MGLNPRSSSTCNFLNLVYNLTYFVFDVLVFISHLLFSARGILRSSPDLRVGFKVFPNLLPCLPASTLVLEALRALGAEAPQADFCPCHRHAVQCSDIKDQRAYTFIFGFVYYFHTFYHQLSLRLLAFRRKGELATTGRITGANTRELDPTSFP